MKALLYKKEREFMLSTPELRSAGACKKHNKDLILCVCDKYYQTALPTFHSRLKLFREMNELPEEAHCHPPRLWRFVSLHSCRLPDPSQLWLWNASRDVATLSYSSMDVPAKLLAQVKILHHLKISLLLSAS